MVLWADMGVVMCVMETFFRADDVLSQQFHHLMHFEFSESVSEAVSTMSRQDRQALNIYEESARLVGGHYQIAIPWKCHSPDLLNNKPLAELRLNLLRTKLLKVPELYSRYSAFMPDLLSKGYAKKVPENFRMETTRKYGTFPIILWCFSRNLTKFAWSVVEYASFTRS